MAEVKGLIPVLAYLFSGLVFATYKSFVYTCDDLLSYNSSLRISHIWFSYIHKFKIYFLYFYTHRFAISTRK